MSYQDDIYKESVHDWIDERDWADDPRADIQDEDRAPSAARSLCRSCSGAGCENCDHTGVVEQASAEGDDDH